VKVSTYHVPDQVARFEPLALAYLIMVMDHSEIFGFDCERK